MTNKWVLDAIREVNADFNRSSDTHLLKITLPASPKIHIYFKDESTHITGSLKHRLARSLYLYALCNGWIGKNTMVFEASSGSTAVSEAYYARLLGLRFTAVMARGTSPEKIKRIKFFGGNCVLVDDPSTDCTTAVRLAQENNGHFMDQFTFAERATDWRGNNNIAESIFEQLSLEPYPVPRWIVCGAGTGGTSATFGRFIRYQGYQTKVCVVDPCHSVFYRYYKGRDASVEIAGGSGVEGIGRPRVPKSFVPDIIDQMIQVPNAASYAAIHFLRRVLGKRCGGSTGTNLYGVFQLAAEMIANGEEGSIVTLICDDGKLYEQSYYNELWLEENNIKIDPYIEQLERFYETGVWVPVEL